MIAMAVTNGMQRDLQERLLGSTAHVRLMRVKSDGIRNWRPLLERLRALPHVTAAAPGLYEQVMVSRGARAGAACSRALFLRTNAPLAICWRGSFWDRQTRLIPPVR